MTLILLLIHFSFYFSIDCSIFFQPYNSAKIPIYLFRKRNSYNLCIACRCVNMFFLALRTLFKKQWKSFTLYCIIMQNIMDTLSIFISAIQNNKKSYLQKMLFCWFGPLHLIIICLIWVSPFLDLVITSYLGCFDYVPRTSSIRIVSAEDQPLLVGSRQDDFSAVSAIRRTAALRAPFLASLTASTLISFGNFYIQHWQKTIKFSNPSPCMLQVGPYISGSFNGAPCLSFPPMLWQLYGNSCLSLFRP